MKTADELLNHACKRSLKEHNSKRFWLLPTGFGEKVIFQLFVLGCKDQNHFASIVIISSLQNVIQDQAANATSMGMSACDLK